MGCRAFPSTHTEHRATHRQVPPQEQDPIPGQAASAGWGTSGGCHQQVQPAKAQRMMSSKTEPHICRPLYLLGTRPAAVTCSVMALKESALTQVQEDVESDISLLMPRGSGCRLIPLLSPEAEPSLPPGISGFNQPPLGVTLSPITAHLGRALVSAAAGRLPRRVHSTGGVAVGTSCNSTLQGIVAARTGAWQRVAQDWSQICPNSTVRRVWRRNATLFSSSECDCSRSISSNGATPVRRAQVPDRAGLGTHQTQLSFCSGSSGRAAEWELGVHQGWKDPSFSSHQTTPAAHPQP